MKGEELITIDTFEVKKTFWTMAYGLIPLTKEDTIIAQINKSVEQDDGDGIINLTVIIDQGVTNKIFSFLMYVPSYIPFVPGSARITVRGEIVKLVHTQQNQVIESYIPKEDIYLALKQRINETE
ncbi:hypothetical protein ACE01N_07170 [Saccharicrinis sp. FJH2]|uniref:hypothetical protein n=1 Tax=Saccharicrinis sp. FJH65 TaxID=3344659 RepID=UPI0035F4A532